jgi:hypothetical protein
VGGDIYDFLSAWDCQLFMCNKILWGYLAKDVHWYKVVQHCMKSIDGTPLLHPDDVDSLNAVDCECCWLRGSIHRHRQDVGGDDNIQHTRTECMQVGILSHSGDEAHLIVSDNRHGEDWCMCDGNSCLYCKFSSVRYNGCKYFKTTAGTKLTRKSRHVHGTSGAHSSCTSEFTLAACQLPYRPQGVTLLYKIQSTGSPV